MTGENVAEQDAVESAVAVSAKAVDGRTGAGPHGVGAGPPGSYWNGFRLSLAHTSRSTTASSSRLTAGVKGCSIP